MVNVEAGDTVRRCPLDDCSWVHIERPFITPMGALISALGYGVIAQQQIESALRAHFEEHTAEDYLRTIARLRGLCLKNGVEP